MKASSVLSEIRIGVSNCLELTVGRKQPFNVAVCGTMSESSLAK